MFPVVLGVTLKKYRFSDRLDLDYISGAIDCLIRFGRNCVLGIEKILLFVLYCFKNVSDKGYK